MPEFFFRSASWLQRQFLRLLPQFLRQFCFPSSYASSYVRHFWYNLFSANYLFTDTDYEAFDDKVLYNLC